ncbi:MAG: ATP-binding cassette domain-containing protein, partial [Pseudomonadota bacterium]|nr:ATP-binding cassette domain-containing protein [Pseudomonadota bacterium]
MTTAVKIDNVSIVFGKSPDQALPLMDKGLDRATVQEKCGQVLGVHDCNLEIQEGEILVLMGLSGSGKSTLCSKLKEKGFKIHSSDEQVAKIYKNPEKKFVTYLRTIG